MSNKITKREKKILLVTLIPVFIAVLILTAVAESNKEDSANLSNEASKSASNTNQNKDMPRERVVSGEQKTLTTGKYTVPTDLKPGYYDVTTPSGSGNIFVNGGNSYNEILGGDIGVRKVRMLIVDNSSIEISGLSSVVFTPIDAPFVKEHKTTDLYAGTFIVGEDIGAGKYVAKPAPGESGNFFVDGSTLVNEILGGEYGVDSYTVTLKAGDVIKLNGFNSVTFTKAE